VSRGPLDAGKRKGNGGLSVLWDVALITEIEGEARVKTENPFWASTASRGLKTKEKERRGEGGEGRYLRRFVNG